MTRIPRKTAASAMEEEIIAIAGKQPRKRTRATKAAAPDGHREVKAKFVEERVAKAVPLVAKTPNQQKYIDLMKKCVVTCSLGASGAGKTWCAATFAANEFLRGQYERIVLLRPVEPVSGKTLGFRPGSPFE